MEASISARGGSASSTLNSRLLQKLLVQQARLHLLHPPRRNPGVVGGASGGGGAGELNSRATDALAAGVRDPSSDLDAAFSTLSTSDIVDVIVGVREDFGGAAGAAANEGVGFGGGGGGGGGGSKGSGATNDLFTSPAFAAGRVFSFATMDAIITEAHFDSYVVGLVKALVACARKQSLAMLPVRDAWVLLRAAALCHGRQRGGGADPSASATASALAAASAAIGDASNPAALSGLALPQRYGEVFEGLLRAWRILPIGLYRRVHPANGLKTAASTLNAVLAAAGVPSGSGSSASSGAFGHNRALVSYVYSNPVPETKLSPHDVLYIMFSSDGEEDVVDAVELAAASPAFGASRGPSQV